MGARVEIFGRDGGWGRDALVREWEACRVPVCSHRAHSEVPLPISAQQSPPFSESSTLNGCHLEASCVINYPLYEAPLHAWC